MNNFIKDICLRYLEKDIIKCPRENLSKEQEDGLLASLWGNPGFRNYASDRNQRLIYAMVGTPGAAKEPRDRFMELRGQRMEILELFAKAKACSERIQKGLEEKKKQTSQQVIPSS